MRELRFTASSMPHSDETMVNIPVAVISNLWDPAAGGYRNHDVEWNSIFASWHPKNTREIQTRGQNRKPVIEALTASADSSGRAEGGPWQFEDWRGSNWIAHVCNRRIGNPGTLITFRVTLGNVLHVPLL